MEPDKNQVADRARGGDHAAAVQLIEVNYARIYAFLRRRTANDADAADLTQRTFSRVWQALSSFAGRSTVASWMHGIAHHVYLDWRRSQRPTEVRSDDWWAERAAPDAMPDEVAARNELAAAIFASVDELEPELRDTVHLHYYQGLTLQETADALDVAASTVKYRLRQALTELRNKMNSEHRRSKLPLAAKVV